MVVSKLDARSGLQVVAEGVLARKAPHLGELAAALFVKLALLSEP